MDFAIAMVDGLPVVSFDKADTYFNNVLLSWIVPQGSLFAAPAFGHRFGELKKAVPRIEALAEALGREALQWMLDSGRARSIEVTARRDDTTHTRRLVLNARVISGSGRQISFDRFVEVV